MNGPYAHEWGLAESWLSEWRISNPCQSPTAWDAWQARAALSAPAVPPGFVLVPVEPTPEMLVVLAEAMATWVSEIGDDADIYKAVIAAAPSAKEPT